LFGIVVRLHTFAPFLVRHTNQCSWPRQRGPGWNCLGLLGLHLIDVAV